MTQEEDNQNQPSFDQLTEQTPDELAKRVLERDQLSQEEHDGTLRALNATMQTHWAQKVGPWINWLRFALLAASTLFIFVVSTWLISVYLLDMADDQARIEALIAQLGEWALIVVAALFIESKVRKN